MITKETVSFPTSSKEFESDTEFLSKLPKETMELPEDSYDNGYGEIWVSRYPNGKKIEYPLDNCTSYKDGGGDWYSDSKRLVEYKGKYYGVTTYSSKCGVDIHYTGEFMMGELPTETLSQFIDEYGDCVEGDWIFSPEFPTEREFEENEYDEYKEYTSRCDYIEKNLNDRVFFKSLVEYDFDDDSEYQNNGTINSNDFTKEELVELMSMMWDLPTSYLSQIDWDEDSLQSHLEEE